MTSDHDEGTLIWRLRDDNGLRNMWARVHADGRLTISGQDLGASVAIFGEGLTEYEWDWTAEAGQLPRIVEVLGGAPGDDPVVLLTAKAKDGRGQDPGLFLEKAGITLSFWSRVGD